MNHDDRREVNMNFGATPYIRDNRGWTIGQVSYDGKVYTFLPNERHPLAQWHVWDQHGTLVANCGTLNEAIDAFFAGLV